MPNFFVFCFSSVITTCSESHLDSLQNFDNIILASAFITVYLNSSHSISCSFTHWVNMLNLFLIFILYRDWYYSTHPALFINSPSLTCIFNIIYFLFCSLYFCLIGLHLLIFCCLLFIWFDSRVCICWYLFVEAEFILLEAGFGNK